MSVHCHFGDLILSMTWDFYLIHSFFLRSYRVIPSNYYSINLCVNSSFVLYLLSASHPYVITGSIKRSNVLFFRNSAILDFVMIKIRQNAFPPNFILLVISGNRELDLWINCSRLIYSSANSRVILLVFLSSNILFIYDLL